MRGVAEQRGLSKLLKLAKTRVDEETARIAGLERTLGACETSLEALDRAVAKESALANKDAGAAFADLSGFLAGAASKRQALGATRDRLSKEISSAETDLRAAHAEMKKLEHLIGLSAADAKRAAAKSEEAALDDAVRHQARSRAVN